VARDWLVSFRNNRYSVPFRLIGQTVEVQARDGQVQIFHRDRLVATHALRSGRHELSIQPEHGPGAVVRNTRHRYGERYQPTPDTRSLEVEVRDLALYDRISGVAS
jgi:hypothetical protein